MSPQASSQANPTSIAADRAWINARIATMMPGHASYGALSQAVLLTSGAYITWIGAMAKLPAATLDRVEQVVDVAGRWITPGLVDCHTHVVYGGNRVREFELRLAGATYEELARAAGGILSTVAATRAASEDQLYASARQRVLTMMAEGVTTLEIKSGYGLDLESECKMLRVARRLGRELPLTVQTTFLAAHTIPAEMAGRGDAYIDAICRDILPAAHSAGLVDAVDAFCERIAFSPAQVRRVFAAARELGLPIRIHAEQLSNQGSAYLAATEFAARSADHLEYLDDAGVAALADAGTTAVLLPGAFYFLHETRQPPIAALRAAGVPIALATDCNPGSSPLLSPAATMNLAAVVFALTPEECLAGFTRHGARALGLADRVGTLAAGKAADFAVWDIDSPAELAYQIGSRPCWQRVWQGRVG